MDELAEVLVRRNLDPETEIEDPLSMAVLEVTDFASARYALKVANDQHFAVIHMYEQMRSEFKRSEQETTAQKLYIVRKYVDEPERLTRVPDPLPEDLPAKALAGLLYLDQQLEVERARLYAEWLQNAERPLAIRDLLLLQAEKWFIAEVTSGALWLQGRATATMGGCSLSYSDGVFGWNFYELSYD